eukprot:CAMPEP_0194258138 /NCGR_PEP_ID=MMETSP0158-20130606/40688_1 /TAXON_ID=33649 /ORGANISM="Thalassionema nitzschioides, Strain L26-B" /LENGTH=658 /DNA_ID=CAMNT_0038997441 /DNA_START=110 /DNA_END=2086 /DNA_ORIENTATION=-
MPALPASAKMRIEGNEKCPCVNSSFFPSNEMKRKGYNFPGNVSEISEYGVNCSKHDENGFNECANTSHPSPPHCTRNWCYVDHTRCNLTHKISYYLPTRYYSYATCGELDSFTFTARRGSLKGEKLKVGYNANTGGWKGSYNKNGSFSTDDEWSGPIVDFIKEAALEGGFEIVKTAPPEWLHKGSMSFFGGSSKFDFCVYATSLGYLDFCVGSYTISTKRSSVTTMFETESDPVYLFVHDSANDGWEEFSYNFRLIGQPFSYGAWLLIFFFTLPVMGMLMVFHEYDHPGTAFPKNEVTFVDDCDNKEKPVEIESRKIPLYKHLLSSIYMAFLSFNEGAYSQGVVSISGKIHLIGLAAFVMLILAVYTANLAAILTQDANTSGIDSIKSAVRRGYNVCAERKIAQIVMEAYDVDGSVFVPDPEDGKPGFNCGTCKSRQRVFDFMNHTHTDGSLYCNVAISKLEDLEALQSEKLHCNKTKVGDAIHFALEGIPIYSGRADALVSIFQDLKAKGFMTKSLKAAAPESICPESGGEGTALNVDQLSGVWIVTFGFAMLALLSKCILYCKRRKRQKKSSRKIRTLRRHDQWGNPPPYEVIIGGYRYDAEGHELQKMGGHSTTITEEIEPLCDDHTHNHHEEGSHFTLRRSRSLMRGVASVIVE